MRRFKKMGALGTWVLGLAVLSPATPAAALDVWYDTGAIIDGATGQRKCTLGAGFSSTGSTVTGRGSISCNRPYDQLELQVCIQVQQPLVDEGATWKDYSCAPPVVKSGSNASASVTASCLPGTWDYRSKVVFGGYDDNEPPFTSIGVSSSHRVTCLVE